MNMQILSVWLLALTAVPDGAPVMRLEPWRHPDNEAMRVMGRMYLDGAFSGLMAANVRAPRHGGVAAFCMPGDLALTTTQLEEIVYKAADKRSAKGDTPVSMLLLSGLVDTYPCEKSEGPKNP